MLNNISNIHDIRSDLINFINIVKDFKVEKTLIEDEDLNYIEYEVSPNYEYKENEIEDTWLDEIEFFSQKLNEIDTENLIIISKIISLGKDLVKGQSEKEKVIIIQNEYLSSLYEEREEYYKNREEIIEDLFSKKGDLIIKYIELGAKKLNLI